jgi:predicted nucleic acid-binding protein
MEILIDADVIIRGEKGLFDLKSWTATRASDQFGISAVTIAELWHGVERASGNQKTSRENYLLAAVSALSVIPYTEQIAHRHARIWADLQTSGKMIGYYDLIVASTALEIGAVVATFNKRHFGQVKGLQIIEPK